MTIKLFKIKRKKWKRKIENSKLIFKEAKKRRIKL